MADQPTDHVSAMNDAELARAIGRSRAAKRRIDAAVPAPRSASAIPASSCSTVDARTRQLSTEVSGILPRASQEQLDAAADGAGHRIVSIAPRDAIEEMLAAQMLALHHAAMDCARRAVVGAHDFDTRREELNLLAKSSRAFAHLTDTLDRRRRGGEQTVRVEHVHVHSGGQAIVGNVAGGGRTKNGE